MAANTQATVTIQNLQSSPCPAGATVQFTFYGLANYGSPNLLQRTASSAPAVVAGSGGDFTVTIGAPSAPTLSSQGSISYPVTVTSIGLAGYVNLTLSAPPAGVTAQFYPSQVYIGGSGSQASSTLTLTSSASTPGGTFPLVVTGTLGNIPRTAAFSLGTQVTAFHVTSSTGSSTVHNTGQEVQVMQNVPAGNAPAYQTCSTPDSDVVCRVIASASGSVTLGVTASPSAAHGTRGLRLNGGAAIANAAIGDRGPSLSSVSPSVIQAGQPTDATISGSGLDRTCHGEAFCGFPQVIVNGPQGQVGWVYIGQVGYSSISVTLNPPANAAGNYQVYVDSCGGFFDPDDAPAACEDGPVGLEVDAPPQPPAPTISAVTPNKLLAGAPTSVTITGTNFASPATLAATDITFTNIAVVTANQITATATVSTTASGGLTILKATVNAQDSNGVQVKKQIPKKLIRYDFPPDAPGGIGILHTITDGDVLDLSGTVRLSHKCGMYRSYVFDLIDQDDIPIEAAYTLTEYFTDYTGVVSVPPAQDFQHGATDILQDMQFFGKAAPDCSGANDNETFNQKFYVTSGNHRFDLTTVINIKRGNFSGVAHVDETVSTQ